MTTAFVSTKNWLAALVCAALMGCGGGGGGGASNPPPPVITPPAGTFSMSSSTVAFSAKRQRGLPATQIVRVVADAMTAGIGAAFVAPQSAPSWLTVAVTGSAPNYEIVLGITTTDRPTGPQSAVLTVTSTNAASAVLTTQQVTINYTVLAPLATGNSLVNTSIVFGHSTSTTVTNATVTADATTQWSATSSQPWVTVPATAITGNGNVPITVDSATMIPGISSAIVTLTNIADAGDTATIAVIAEITEPVFTVGPSPIVIGGAEGLDFTGGETLQVALGTGTNIYAWTATPTTLEGGNWLSVAPASGTLGGTMSATPVANANRALIAPGRYRGALRVAATVRGREFAREVPVTFNKEGHWLHASALGAAFSQFPARSVLTRAIEVSSSQGRSDVPWTAVSNTAWLGATASGNTGADLVLTANPMGLANGQHYGIVTVSSPNADVLNTQVIRVGLRVGDANPGTVRLGFTPSRVAANPVEPYVYANSGGTNVTVYDVYSAAVVRTFTNAAVTADTMVVSHDGRTLYINDSSARLVRAVDAETGAPIRTFAWPSNGDASYGLGYARPKGHAIVIMGGNEFYDATTGALHTARHSAGWYAGLVSIAVDPFDTYLYAATQGLSPTSISRYALDYSALNADGLAVTAFGEFYSSGGNGRDLCLSADGSRLYSANGAPYVFLQYDAHTLAALPDLAATNYPNNAACGWNGMFVGGVDAYYNDADTWAYRLDGSLIASFSLHGVVQPNSMTDQTLVLSGDNTRLIGGTSTPSFDFIAAPVP